MRKQAIDRKGNKSYATYGYSKRLVQRGTLATATDRVCRASEAIRIAKLGHRDSAGSDESTSVQCVKRFMTYKGNVSGRNTWVRGRNLLAPNESQWSHDNVRDSVSLPT
jgi:hypothetical protein